MSGRLQTLDGRAVIQCLDPRTLEETATVSCTPVDEVAARVAAAREAAQGWAAQPLRARKEALQALRGAFLARADDVVALLAEECGRPAGEAWTAEVAANNGLFGWWLSHIDDLLAPDRVDISPLEYPGKRGLVRLEPVGVLGLIMPWNFPVALPLRAMVPGLLAGNGIVLKPSEHTPRLGALLGELCAKHLPSGLVQVVQGGGEQGAAVVASSVDRVLFTGSVATGKKVHVLAAEHFKPTSLELGGKDAAVVLPDADPARAAAGIVWAAFGFAGQNCAAIERAYIHTSLFEEVRAQIVERAEALRPLLDVGPLVTAEQLEIVKRHIADAVDKGATVETGGEAEGPGWYHQPTVLTGVAETMLVMREETFGPVLPLQPYEDLEAVIEEVNGSDYGLTTSLWTRDLSAAEGLAGRFDCGVVTVNNHAFTGALPSAPWGGTKHTGHGVTNSRFSLYEMVRPRTLVVDSASGDKEMWWYPYNEALVSAARGLTELTRPGGAKLQGIRGALTGLLNRWKAQP